MTNDNGGKLFFLGLGIGVATAFLLAPRSGRDARQFLREKADEGTDFLKRCGQELASSARHEKDRVMAAVVAGRDAFRNGKITTTPERDYQL